MCAACDEHEQGSQKHARLQKTTPELRTKSPSMNDLGPSLKMHLHAMSMKHARLRQTTPGVRTKIPSILLAFSTKAQVLNCMLHAMSMRKTAQRLPVCALNVRAFSTKAQA